MSAFGSRRPGGRHSRRQLLGFASWLLVTLGIGPARAGSPTASVQASADGRPADQPAIGSLRDIPLRDVRRIDAADDGGWWARDAAGHLWHVEENGRTDRVAEGVDPGGMLASGHGRVAGRGLDGRLWVHDAARPASAPGRSAVPVAPQGGLCVLPLAVIALVEQSGRHVLARFEADAGGQWQVVARSREPVLPDAVPVIVDLDGRGDGGHIAVLAGPDSQRYPHAVLGDDIEATRVIWLERHGLEALRSIGLDAPEVFEDRLLRPWRWPDGRTGLVTVRSGPRGAQLVVVAASRDAPAELELAAIGPALGTRNRWLSPASVGPAGGEIWAVHTPHIGGVLHRYRPDGAALVPEPVATGLSNHRLGSRDLDLSARVGPWLLLPAQDGRRARAVDVTRLAVREAVALDAPIGQWVASSSGRGAALLAASRLALWLP